MSGFNVGLSGLRAASTDLEVTGNNVANASTIGFKQSRTEFADLYTNTLLGSGSSVTGTGVKVDNIKQQFSQGSISGTDSALDLAIDGAGFFVLNDQGSQTFTRSGLFSLDRDGYVVANNGARLRGFPANENGAIDGVLSDIQIAVTNQAPRLTSLASAVVNLDAGESVLQEQGLQLNASGLAIGVPDSGIPLSTTSTLATAGQPRTAGTSTNMAFAGGAGSTVADVGTNGSIAGGETIDINLGDGVQTVTLTAVAAGATEAETLSSIQQDIDDALGDDEITAEVGTNGELVLRLAGYQGTDGSTFSVANTANWDAIFGAAGAVNAGSEGDLLFVGSNPILADFRSFEGTQTSSRTQSTPPLEIVESDPGEMAVLTADSAYSNLNLSTAGGNVLAFSVASEAGDTYDIELSEASWVGGAPADYANVDVDEAVDEINAQITNAAGAGNEQVVAFNSGGVIEFRSQAPAVEGDYIQIGDNNADSVNFDLTDLGFAEDNDFAAGVEPVEANNEFQLEVTSTTGNGGGPFTITIPPNDYSSLESLASAIQEEIDQHIGASGIADKVSVSVAGSQIVFVNSNVGSGEGVSITGTTAEPQAVSALGFDDLYVVDGDDTVDRSNSFRITLNVPAPDNEGRSGSVSISLDEEYRSVQHLASSINRQLNSQTGDDYIGVLASAVEIEPRVSPPQYQLQFTATEAGENSTISVSNLDAGGEDISIQDLYAILQVDPNDTSLLTTGIEGVTNEYPEQLVTLVDPDGNETEIRIPEDAQANEIVALFNRQPGVTASANTMMTLLDDGYNNPGGTMTLNLNGQTLTSSTLPELADEINSYQGTTLPGFEASINDNGDLEINNRIGQDIQVTIDSPEESDGITVQGKEGTGTVALGGSENADISAVVGGEPSFIFNEGYKLKDPEPAISGIFGTLDDSEYESYILNSFDPNDQDTYNHATSSTIFDSLGNSHVMTQYFVREPLDPNDPDAQSVWAMYVQVDGQDVGDPDPSLTFPESLEPTQARFELFFDQNGSLDEATTGNIFITNWDPVDENGEPTGALTSSNVLEGGLPLSDPANSSNFQIDLAGSTHFGSPFSINEVDQNGYAAGRMTSLSVDDEGVIFARFTNGQAQTLGQVALAYFRDPEGLNPVGDTSWGESFESGVPTIGSPQTGAFGAIQSAALEDSNVDLSEELVGLIIAQRNFQANAKTIETSDQVTQTILNI